MSSESFKCFFAITVLDGSNFDLTLLSHIYAKVAICKSCERPPNQLPISPKSGKTVIPLSRRSNTLLRHSNRVGVVSSRVLTVGGVRRAVTPAPKGYLLNTPLVVDLSIGSSLKVNVLPPFYHSPNRDLRGLGSSHGHGNGGGTGAVTGDA